MRIDEVGISNHADEDGFIDHNKDGDHVALLDES